MKGRVFAVLAIFSIVGGIAFAEENPMFTNGQVNYYKSMKTCTPATFAYDALMMGYKNTNKIVGKQDGKCVITEEITPNATMVCKLPMHVASKYAEEQLKIIQGNAKFIVQSEYVDKVRNNKEYCNIEIKESLKSK